MMKEKENLLMTLSVVSIIIAGIVSVFQIDLWLAGTQWILVGIVLAIYALYFKAKNAA